MFRRLADKKESIIVEKSGASSAKSFANDSKQLERSFVQTKYSSKPSIESFGTLALTNDLLGSWPLRTTFRYQLLRKLWKRLRRSPDIPTVSSL